MILTVASLFSPTAQATYANAITAFDQTSNSSVFIGIGSTENDKIYRSTGSGDWVTVFEGRLESVSLPLDHKVTGVVPARIQTTTHNSRYTTFTTNLKYGVLSPSYPTAVVPRPEGNLKRNTWALRDVGGLKVFLTSIESDSATQTLITDIEGKRSLVASDEFTSFTGIKNQDGKLENEKWVFDSKSFSLTSPVAHPVEVAPPKTSDRIEDSKIMITGTKGEQVNAWTFAQPFIKDLKAEAPLATEPDETSKDLIKQIFRNLIKREVGSVKILGPAGTGKTYLIKLLIKQILAGKAPAALKDTYFFQIDPTALSAGTNYVGSIETKLNALLELSKAYSIVWVIDEAHLLRGMGTHSSNSNDVLQSLKPGLTEGYFRMIAMSTDHEWNAAFASDPALDQRFGEVKKVEPTGEALRIVLRGFASKHSFPEIDDVTLDRVIHLSSEFNATGAQPRKGTLLIEEIFADQQLEGPLHSPTGNEVNLAAQRIYNLDPSHFDPAKMRARLGEMPKVLSESVIGQDAAKEELINTFKISIAGLEDKNKPKGRKIVAGPRGQGKTELIKAAGVAMKLPVNRIVMTTYTSASQTEELKRVIAQAVRRQANCILFFDEIEKAHPAIQKDLLDLLDSGQFSVTESSNSKSSLSVDISVRNAYVFMATNAGADYISSLPDSSHYNLTEMREAMHRDGLNDLVLDRMDGVVPFFYLSRAKYQKVVVKQVRSILRSYETNNPGKKLHLENLRGFIDKVVRETYRDKMSNREALVSLSANLRTRMADAFVKNQDTVALPGERTKKRPESCEALF